MAVVWVLDGLFQAMVYPPIVCLFAASMSLEQQKGACVNINATTPADMLGYTNQSKLPGYSNSNTAQHRWNTAAPSIWNRILDILPLNYYNESKMKLP